LEDTGRFIADAEKFFIERLIFHGNIHDNIPLYLRHNKPLTQVIFMTVVTATFTTTFTIISRCIVAFTATTTATFTAISHCTVAFMAAFTAAYCLS
jgi:hypothetical protein